MPATADAISTVWHINLLDGRCVDIRDLKSDDIWIEDIAHSLSNQNRYMGRSAFPYSVAHHSLIVDDMVKKHHGIGRASYCALSHDFGEAYYYDLARGIKRGLVEWCPEFQKLMDDIDRKIYQKFNLHDYERYHDIIKDWDNRVARAEKVQIFNGVKQEWPNARDIEPAPVRISYMPPGVAMQQLIAAFKTYEACVNNRGW